MYVCIKLSVLCNTVCVPGLFLVSDLDAKREVKYEEVSMVCAGAGVHTLHYTLLACSTQWVCAWNSQAAQVALVRLEKRTCYLQW